jgi:hypothetical protein
MEPEPAWAASFGTLLPAPGERDWGRQVILQPSVNGGSQACTGTLQGNKCYTPGWLGWWGGSPKDAREHAQDLRWRSRAGCRRSTLRPAGPTPCAGDRRRDRHRPWGAWNPTATGLDHREDRDGGRVDLREQVDREQTGLDRRDGGTRRTFRLFLRTTTRCSTTSCRSSLRDALTRVTPRAGSTAVRAGPNKALVGRFVGAAKGNLSGPNPGTMNRMLRLVE